MPKYSTLTSGRADFSSITNGKKIRSLRNGKSLGLVVINDISLLYLRTMPHSVCRHLSAMPRGFRYLLSLEPTFLFSVNFVDHTNHDAVGQERKCVGGCARGLTHTSSDSVMLYGVVLYKLCCSRLRWSFTTSLWSAVLLRACGFSRPVCAISILPCSSPLTMFRYWLRGSNDLARTSAREECLPGPHASSVPRTICFQVRAHSTSRCDRRLHFLIPELRGKPAILRSCPDVSTRTGCNYYSPTSNVYICLALYRRCHFYSFLFRLLS